MPDLNQPLMRLSIPADYRSVLNLKETEKAIKLIKDFFEQNLASELKLRRVTAPLFVLRGTGINDDLNGIERPVSFKVRDMNDSVAEVVHSLAKWKRMRWLTGSRKKLDPGTAATPISVNTRDIAARRSAQ